MRYIIQYQLITNFIVYDRYWTWGVSSWDASRVGHDRFNANVMRALLLNKKNSPELQISTTGQGWVVCDKAGRDPWGISALCDITKLTTPVYFLSAHIHRLKMCTVHGKHRPGKCCCKCDLFWTFCLLSLNSMSRQPNEQDLSSSWASSTASLLTFAFGIMDKDAAAELQAWTELHPNYK